MFDVKIVTDTSETDVHLVPMQIHAPRLRKR